MVIEVETGSDKREERGALGRDVRFASVSLDTDIDIPHMRTPPARIAAAALAT